MNTSDTSDNDPTNDRDSASHPAYTIQDTKKSNWFTNLFSSNKNETSKDSIRESIAEYIDETIDEFDIDLASYHERLLLSNILELRDMTVNEIMVPRADIKALEISTPQDEVLKFFAGIQVSRVPVYDGTLDEVRGTIHIKDILGVLAINQTVVIEDLVTDVPVISPSMPLLDLMLQMRQSRRHMALVVDEFGGIDGLVTIGDIIEAIIGEIDDEHDTDDDPKMAQTANGSVLADARIDLDDFCEQYGDMLTEEEHKESDTLGGLAFSLAGKVPARGEIITHESGMLLEIIDADPRRINRMRIRNIPKDHNKPTQAE